MEQMFRKCRVAGPCYMLFCLFWLLVPLVSPKQAEGGIFHILMLA